MAAQKAHVGILIAATILYGTTVRAHHSFGAEYDSQRPVTVTGVVTKIEWTNPHCHFYVDVTDEKRDVTMKAGDRVTVTGWRARDGGPWAHSREITLPSGQKMFFGPPVGTGEGGNAPAVEVK